MLVVCCNKEALFACVGRYLGGIRIVCTDVSFRVETSIRMSCCGTSRCNVNVSHLRETNNYLSSLYRIQPIGNNSHHTVNIDTHNK